MVSDKLISLTIPLFPYVPQGCKKSHLIKRIRPADSLNLKKTVRELKKNALITLDIKGKPWSVTSVYSAYSPDIHLMLVETSPNRCLVGPEKIPAAEGDRLMGVVEAIIEFIAKQERSATINFGYNWSPRSWGKQEERTGFQSIPTKWHPHLWCWPDFNDSSLKKPKYVDFLNINALEPQQKRLFGSNNYAEPLGLFIKNRFKKTFHKKSLFCQLFPYSNWIIDGRGISVPINISIETLLSVPGFFGHVLKPMAAQLDLVMKDLTQTFTTIKCGHIDRILLETEKGYPNKLRLLRADPKMWNEADIKKTFKEKKYPMVLFDALFEPIKNRCGQYGSPIDWWRNGFGYALVFSGSSDENCAMMRIMPGVFVGPGGVVEAQSVILKRPQNKQFSKKEIRKKSMALWRLTENLKEHKFKEFD